MTSFRLLPQVFVACVVFAILARCDADYSVAMIWPRGGQSYDSVVDGKVMFDDLYFGERPQTGRLPVFPCGNSTVSAIQYIRLDRIRIPIRHRMPFQVKPTSPTIGTRNSVLGAWRADVFWGRFRGAAFDSIGTKYTWAPAMERKYRFVGEENWCRGARGVAIPLQSSTVLRPSDLAGVSATLAVRSTYYNPSLSLADPGAHDPVRVTTQVR